VLLFNDCTVGVRKPLFAIGELGKTTFPNYLLHEVIVFSYMRQSEKYDDIE